jgi:hypothetical protein
VDHTSRLNDQARIVLNPSTLLEGSVSRILSHLGGKFRCITSGTILLLLVLVDAMHGLLEVRYCEVKEAL